MADRFINITFPFKDDDVKNYFLKMNSSGYDAIKSDLLHLLLTTPGDRLYLPEFGTNLRQYIFEPNDSISREGIKSEIQDAVSRFIPNLKITQLDISEADESEYGSNAEHSAVVRIDYVVTEGALNKVDFVTITI
jgi:phage baseplate assembly protein W